MKRSCKSGYMSSIYDKQYRYIGNLYTTKTSCMVVLTTEWLPEPCSQATPRFYHTAVKKSPLIFLQSCEIKSGSCLEWGYGYPGCRQTGETVVYKTNWIRQLKKQPSSLTYNHNSEHLWRRSERLENYIKDDVTKGVWEMVTMLFQEGLP